MRALPFFILSVSLIDVGCTGTPMTDAGSDAQPDVVDATPPSDTVDAADAFDATDVVNDAPDVQDVVIDAGPPTFEDMQVMFDHSCAVATTQCHAAETTSSTLRLDRGMSYMNIVNVTSDEVPRLHRVLPNDPMNSYLYLKLQRSTLYAIPECALDAGASACFSPMPAPPMSPLNAAGIDMVRRWIAAGAPSI